MVADGIAQIEELQTALKQPVTCKKHDSEYTLFAFSNINEHKVSCKSSHMIMAWPVLNLQGYFDGIMNCDNLAVFATNF